MCRTNPKFLTFFLNQARASSLPAKIFLCASLENLEQALGTDAELFYRLGANFLLGHSTSLKSMVEICCSMTIMGIKISKKKAVQVDANANTTVF
jgi:hypothetical protein